MRENPEVHGNNNKTKIGINLNPQKIFKVSNLIK